MGHVLSFKIFKKIYLSPDEESNTIENLSRIINQLQSNIEESILSILNKSQNDNFILTNIQLTTGLNIINHKLGKVLNGWNITRLRSNAIIWDIQDTNTQPNLTLLLMSNSNCVIDLKVF